MGQLSRAISKILVDTIFANKKRKDESKQYHNKDEITMWKSAPLTEHEMARITKKREDEANKITMWKSAPLTEHEMARITKKRGG